MPMTPLISQPQDDSVAVTTSASTEPQSGSSSVTDELPLLYSNAFREPLWHENVLLGGNPTQCVSPHFY